MANIQERTIGVGDNSGDIAQRTTDYLNREYQQIITDIETMLEEARELPKDVQNDDDLGLFAKLIKRFRDTTTKLKAYHTAEKEPHLRAGQAVDSFFFGFIDKCARRDRKNKPGAADILQARVDDYQQRKLAEEQARRRREAEEAARKEREQREAAEKAAREAEERRLAAERARKPETIEAKTEQADQARTAADAAAIDHQIAADKATEAYVETLAKPADIVRTRIDEGPLVTMKQEGYAEIIDANTLDKDTLWPFISLDAKEKALRAWAKTTGYTQPMNGASIGKRNKSTVR